MNSKERALNAYVARLAECRDLLGQIEDAVGDHLGVHPDAVHWGHVGDATHLRDLLMEALEVACAQVRANLSAHTGRES